MASDRQVQQIFRTNQSLDHALTVAALVTGAVVLLLNGHSTAGGWLVAGAILDALWGGYTIKGNDASK